MARAINFVFHYPPERLHALTAETVALHSGVPLTEAQKVLEQARGRG